MKNRRTLRGETLREIGRGVSYMVVRQSGSKTGVQSTPEFGATVGELRYTYMPRGTGLDSCFIQEWL